MEIQWVEDSYPETYTIKYVPVIPNEYELQLGVKQITSSGKAVGYQHVSGVINRAKGNQAIGDFDVTVKYQDYEDEEQTLKVEAPKGQLSFYLPTNIPPQNVTLEAKEVKQDEQSQQGETITGKIKVRYNVATTPAELKFAYSDTQNPVTITGKVTDSNGNPVAGAPVELTGNHQGVLSTVTNNDGEFGVVVLKWAGSADYDLKIAGESHKIVTVTPKAAALSVSPKGTVHSLVPVKFTVKGAGFPVGKTASVIVYDSDNERVDVQNLTVSATGKDGAFSATFDWKPSKAGTYTVKATSDHHGASATITVGNPLGYNFINTDQLGKLVVGRNELLFGKYNGTYLVTYDGQNTVEDFVYDVYVDGKLQLDKKLGGTVVVNTAKLGSKTIKVVAFKTEKVNDKWVQVYQQTFDAKITGWDVTMDVTELTVNEAQTITLVVKDEDGNPINNATVEILESGIKALSPANYNAQNGTYVFKDAKIAKPGAYDVKVSLGNTLKASLKLNVVGQKVYSVSADVDTLLQDKSEVVKLTIAKDGTAVIPQRVRLVYDDGTTAELSPTYLGDGITRVDISAAKAGALIVRAENYDGTQCGEVNLDVVAPKLVLVDEETTKVTENFKTKVSFKVIDPRDDSEIKLPITLVPEYATIAVRDANDGLLVGNNLLGADEHTITILATDAQYTTAAKNDEVVAVYLKVNDETLVDGYFAVEKATIESDPGMIIIGAQNNLTLTYKDANGNPIVGKKVVAGESDLGKTDENGQVIYPVGVITGTSVTVKANTDVDKVVTEHTIKMGYDMEAPEVTYDAETKDAKATIVISDNVRLARIKINGEEIDFFAGPKYEHVVTLKPGVNKFHIQAQDTNYNVFDEVIEINYVQEGITFTIGKAEYVANGEAKTLEAAPYLKGDHTMIPVRALEAFGAKIAWDGDTKTVTFKLDEKVVKLTVGSTTALVDGDQVAVPVAPEIVNSRTMVPLRFVLQSLGFKVHWASSGDITITR